MTEPTEDAPAVDDGPGDEENAGRVTISDEDPNRASRIAAAMAVDSDEAPPVPT
jgi:hypothetical protein